MIRKKTPEQVRSVIYGVHPVLETIRAGTRPVLEVYLARGPVIPQDLNAALAETALSVNRVSAEQMRSLTGTLRHQGVAARVGPYPYVDFEDMLEDLAHGTEPVVVLDEVQDPANVGSILRSAECLGARGVILTKDRAAPISPLAEKASAGASAHVPVARVVNLARTLGQLKEIGFWIYAADSAGKDTCYSADLSGKIALVLGSEGKGLRRLVRETCDLGVSIPMVGSIQSLNVAQAAAVLLAECLRRRTAVQPGTRQS
ncbi:MAG: 23S rRNA (guanosine(2251)-2'-O)-methyltransferase RlmB [Pseudomonadota bacterium]